MSGRKSCPLVFLLPQGLTVTGIITWAVSVVRAMRECGLNATAVVHGGVRGHAELAIDEPGIIHLDLPRAETITDEHAVGNWAAAYRELFESISAQAGEPVAVIPTRHDACFAAVAAIVRESPALVRPILWQQVDSRYEDALAVHFEPMAAALVGASAFLGRRLEGRFPHRKDDVQTIVNAVSVLKEAPHRMSTTGRAVRLLYAGRLEHEQKRIGALIAMSDVLTKRKIEHELRIAGDGPALAELRDASEKRGSIQLLGALNASAVGDELNCADALVLPSRAEGLSFSVLEAMAHGCAVVLTRTNSGSDEAIGHAVSGWIVDAPDDETEVGEAMAQGVEAALAHGMGQLGIAAHARVREIFSLAVHIEAITSLCKRLAATPERIWPIDRPLLARAGHPGESAMAQHIAHILSRNPSHRFVIHGAGAHTCRYSNILSEHAANILALSDDDRSRWGETLLGWRIIEPQSAASLGATDVLISSDLHEQAIWDRRVIYEQQGLRVHRLYAGADADCMSRPLLVSEGE